MLDAAFAAKSYAIPTSPRIRNRRCHLERRALSRNPDCSSSGNCFASARCSLIHTACSSLSQSYRISSCFNPSRPATTHIERLQAAANASGKAVFPLPRVPEISHARPDLRLSQKSSKTCSSGTYPCLAISWKSSPCFPSETSSRGLICGRDASNGIIPFLLPFLRWQLKSSVRVVALQVHIRWFRLIPLGMCPRVRFQTVTDSCPQTVFQILYAGAQILLLFPLNGTNRPIPLSSRQYLLCLERIGSTFR